ncbi:tetratricopeptide repeat protein [Fundidesulfovibrio agrisoli]|uniref:tetratricopeptide repeat protein n=1 Tax=Fundidesulfovibrio agrisoli TaxID=2922717 RepID=UPI001FAC9E7E|nr:tetratricopeptide repeat protein [Fundidesulfovibrio agrisoli]
MTSKIEFYREVLSDDPNSRVFFPLSRMLAAQGETEEAVAVLQKSIQFHPAHMEAKFLLVELLMRLGREEEASCQFDAVSPLLADYPAVWTLWAAKAPGLSKDAALALRFLALSLQGKEVSWLSLMEQGLNAQIGDAPTSSRAPSRPLAEAPAAGRSAACESEPFSLRGAEEVMALTQRIEAQQRHAPAEMLPPECASENVAAVRTRTMAELLARHGDYAAALEIYGDLLRLASSEQEKKNISARIEEINLLVSSGASPAKSAPEAQPKSGAKLVSMLEALANRLDARATA